MATAAKTSLENITSHYFYYFAIISIQVSLNSSPVSLTVSSLRWGCSCLACFVHASHVCLACLAGSHIVYTLRFVSCLRYITATKFQQYHCNISQDILNFMIYLCTETTCDQFFQQKLQYLWNKRRYNFRTKNTSIFHLYIVCEVSGN